MGSNQAPHSLLNTSCLCLCHWSTRYMQISTHLCSSFIFMFLILIKLALLLCYCLSLLIDLSILRAFLLSNSVWLAWFVTNVWLVHLVLAWVFLSTCMVCNLQVCNLFLHSNWRSLTKVETWGNTFHHLHFWIRTNNIGENTWWFRICFL